MIGEEIDHKKWSIDLRNLEHFIGPKYLFQSLEKIHGEGLVLYITRDWDENNISMCGCKCGHIHTLVVSGKPEIKLMRKLVSYIINKTDKLSYKNLKV